MRISVLCLLCVLALPASGGTLTPVAQEVTLKRLTSSAATADPRRATLTSGSRRLSTADFRDGRIVLDTNTIPGQAGTLSVTLGYTGAATTLPADAFSFRFSGAPVLIGAGTYLDGFMTVTTPRTTSREGGWIGRQAGYDELLSSFTGGARVSPVTCQGRGEFLMFSVCSFTVGSPAIALEDGDEVTVELYVAQAGTGPVLDTRASVFANIPADIVVAPVAGLDFGPALPWVAAVPLPAGAWLFLAGIGGLAAWRQQSRISARADGRRS